MASHILSEVEKVCSHVAILKNGNLLEQGNVRTIIGGESLLELSATETGKLEELLKECPFVKWIKKEDKNFLVTLETGKESSDLNTFLFSKGISLSLLISHKKSLESQFLELVKEDKA